MNKTKELKKVIIDKLIYETVQFIEEFKNFRRQMLYEKISSVDAARLTD